MILVVIPSRDRPALFQRAAQSVLETSTGVRVIGAVDYDDPQLEAYRQITLGERVCMAYDHRIGPARSADRVMMATPGWRWAGLMTDDCVVTTPGWEGYLTAEYDRREGIGVVSPAHNFGQHVDMPFVTDGWVKALGWFAQPKMRHFCWPTAIALLAENAGRLTRAPVAAFAVHHEQQATYAFEATSTDAVALYSWLLHGYDYDRDAILMAAGEM